MPANLKNASLIIFDNCIYNIYISYNIIRNIE